MKQIIDFMKHRLLGNESSTWIGALALLLGLGLIATAFLVDGETYANVSDAIKYVASTLVLGGVGGMLFPEKRA